LKNSINLAFIYGSIVGNVEFDQVVETIWDAEKILNREINPTVYSIREFTLKLRGNFLKNVLSEKKLFIIGNENDLRDLGPKCLA
jgi:uncharacterized protein